MRHDRLALFLHLVWATWDRLPLIEPSIERRIYRLIVSQAQDLGCKVLALNGMPDHVHLIITFPTTVTIANIVKQVKGTSSRFVNETVKPDTLFKWQGSYGAFTVSRWDLDKIVSYVERQKEHHQAGDLYPEWEEGASD
jgi:REP element-mobilizing transposase RayT